MQWHGITGEIINEAVINECYNQAKIIQTDNNNNKNVGYAGGIVGVMGPSECQITHCYNVGEMETTGRWIGGISGGITRGGKVQNCYNTGKIVAKQNIEENNFSVGGIVCNTYYDETGSRNICEITNSYNLGEILSTSSKNGRYMGGILGYIQNGYAKVENCYQTGNVVAITPAGAYIAGITGYIREGPYITIKDCASTSNTIGVSANANVINVVGNQTDLPDVLEIINIESEEVFVEDTENINNGYPILKWQSK